MKRQSYSTLIKVDGPFFTKDPSKTFRTNVHEMMLAVAREGARDVMGQIATGNHNRAPIAQIGDHVSDHVAGEMRSAPTGPGYSAVVFVRNRGYTAKEAISMMAAAAFVEKHTHAFRKTAGRIRRARGVNLGELFKGLD